ncbi:Nn.00g010950.m01.CDS01 [Neocucurbitaria sp. VM-36]
MVAGHDTSANVILSVDIDCFIATDNDSPKPSRLPGDLRASQRRRLAAAPETATLLDSQLKHQREPGLKTAKPDDLDRHIGEFDSTIGAPASTYSLYLPGILDTNLVATADSSRTICHVGTRNTNPLGLYWRSSIVGKAFEHGPILWPSHSHWYLVMQSKDSRLAIFFSNARSRVGATVVTITFSSASATPTASDWDLSPDTAHLKNPMQWNASSPISYLTPPVDSVNIYIVNVASFPKPDPSLATEL